ncbi:Aspartate--tRNA ligase [Corynebacterium pseudopelargi]|uniref:Aspartate--tRNA(Asp/Asn) ligase n=1 Tax=Corynebacterium pseudopelargi TaxID=2080757 RepID=A0A3G6IYF4_9CORY|nr:Aspartate--tRNA ligase [Corynebacterium pseudopelargi]
MAGLAAGAVGLKGKINGLVCLYAPKWRENREKGKGFGAEVLRTDFAGDLRKEAVGQTVTLSGWVARRRDHGGVIFIDLRDASGVAQVVFRDSSVAEQAHHLRSEFCVKVTGVVEARPEGSENPNLASGDIEVSATELEVLNESAALPFQIDDPSQSGEVGEETRLKYRYLDLRRSSQNNALRLRSKANQAARRVLDRHDFVEIETPTLTRSTPEGARDFLVPARLKPGSWYALPQSPQLFKQLLMVAGMERYYQIARCYRDEDFRADRQPEFTQLDVEMSFVDQEDVIALAEEILKELWSLIGYEITTPIPRMTYAEAMKKYGSDKPDLRFDIEITECTEFFKDTTFRVFQNEYVGAVVMEGGASQPRRQLDAWQEWAKQRGAKGLAYILVGEDGELSGPVAKNITEAERAGIAEHVGAKPGDCIFFAAGDTKSSRALLGAARGEIARKLDLIKEGDWAFTWVVDAPLFEPAADATASGDVALGHSKWTAVHHAFTSPKPEWMDSFDEHPGEATAYAYDIVCNGNEIGGGSIRIHRRDVQERVFKVMGITDEEAQEKFGFLLEAFAFGAPPHGGIAFGWDRIVSLLGGFDSIRDVIAFPKSGGGVDPLTDAPAPIPLEQRRETGVDFKPKKKQEADK